jgi:hypothetical protein
MTVERRWCRQSIAQSASRASNGPLWADRRVGRDSGRGIVAVLSAVDGRTI